MVQRLDDNTNFVFQLNVGPTNGSAPMVTSIPLFNIFPAFLNSEPNPVITGVFTFKRTSLLSL